MINFQTYVMSRLVVLVAVVILTWMATPDVCVHSTVTLLGIISLIMIISQYHL